MLAALAFLTSLPVGAGRRPSGRTLLWFPVVGALLGGVLGVTWRLLDRITRGQGLLVASLMVAADLALTGALHFDGLVDSADGLFAPVERARRLAIMAEPTVGAFGLAAGLVVLLLRIACFAQLAPRPLLLIGLWCASRTVMACVAAALPYARGEGLASAFLDGMPEALIIGVPGALLAVVAAAGAGLRGPLAVAAGLVAALGVALLARRRLGGFTGDVLGACGMVCETVGLIVATLR
ncbi:MAG: adenosylcobinamide-GDP ribazoletransferase [Acidimicrobiales bacterium]